jgi:hypothetical protein
MAKEDIKETISFIMKEIALFLFSKSQDNITEMGISDTGALLLSGEVIDGKPVSVVYSAPYASAINDGTKPHKVSPKDLELWVKRKLRVPRKDIKKVSYLISNKIKKMGTEPKPFMDNAIAFTQENFKL